MGPVRQNPIQRTVITAHLSVFMTVYNSVHSTTQNSSDNLPSCLQTTIIAHVLSIGGEGALTADFTISKYLTMPHRSNSKHTIIS